MAVVGEGAGSKSKRCARGAIVTIVAIFVRAVLSIDRANAVVVRRVSSFCGLRAAWWSLQRKKYITQ